MLNVLARISLSVYGVVLLLSLVLLAAAGQRVPIYGLLGILAAIAALADQRTLRYLAVAAIVVAMCLVIQDHYAGKRLRERVEAIRQAAAAPQAGATAPAPRESP
jgi:type III secretory pathway component EscS